MREILFRGKSKDSGEWVERDFLHGFMGFGATIRTLGGAYHPVILETVGQYTGLTDKNEKRVFEGDILRETTLGNYFEIWYDEKECAFMARCVKQVALPTIYRIGESVRLADRCAETIQIIGNAHDNPELLGVIS